VEARPLRSGLGVPCLARDRQLGSEVWPSGGLQVNLRQHLILDLPRGHDVKFGIVSIS
jgi:hypothetical protein